MEGAGLANRLAHQRFEPMKFLQIRRLLPYLRTT